MPYDTAVVTVQCEKKTKRNTRVEVTILVAHLLQTRIERIALHLEPRTASSSWRRTPSRALPY